MRRRAFLALAAPAGILAVGVGTSSLLLAPATGLDGGSTAALGSSLCLPSSTGAISDEQLAAWAYAAGWRGEDVRIAVAIAHAESSVNPEATNRNTNGSTDYGLLQINSIHAAILASGDWRDPAANMRMGFAVWTQAGGSFEPWVTYWSGSYRKHLNNTVACGDPSVSDPGDGPQGSDMMVPRAHNIKMLVRERWGIRDIGGYSYRVIAGTGTLSDHATGHAVDVMLGSDWASRTKNAQGWEISAWLTENFDALGIKYIIFDDRINSGSGWRAYDHPACPAPCGNDTLAHRDHVHVSVR